MTVYNIPMCGNTARRSWMSCPSGYQNLFGDITYAFMGRTDNNRSSSMTATTASPLGFDINFQTAMTVKKMTWSKQSDTYAPVNILVYGSSTGAFSGEETLVKTITGPEVAAASGHQVLVYDVGSEVAYQYYRFKITSFGNTSNATYRCSNICFSFADGEWTWDSETDRVDYLSQIGDSSWMTIKANFPYGSDSTDYLEARFLQFMQIVLDLGWEFADLISMSAMVLYTDGSNSKEPKVPTIVTFDHSRDWIGFYYTYQYVNPETFAGIRLLYQYSFEGTSTYLGRIIVCGNEDLMFISSENNRTAQLTNGITFLGHVPQESVFRPVQTRLTTGVASAGEITLEVESTEDMIEDDYLTIWGNEGEGSDFGIQIVEVIDSTHVTVDSMPRAYASGAYIGTLACAFFRASYNSLFNFGVRYYSGLNTGQMGSNLITPSFEYSNPNGVTNKYNVLPVYVAENAGTNPGIIGRLTTHFGYCNLDVAMACFLEGYQPKLSGTATAWGESTLTDSTKNWTTNELVGKMVLITVGTGKTYFGNYGEIISNDATSFTISFPWNDDLAIGDTYCICDAIWQRTAACTISTFVSKIAPAA